MNIPAESKIKILKDRSKMLQKTRSFFIKKGFLEVDCPSIEKFAPIDAHIDVMSTNVTDKDIGYLHTSPEYGMKKILALADFDIFQLSHVFRKSEIGKNHNPEFMMLEFYQKNVDFDKFVNLTIKFIKLFIKPQKAIKLTYSDLFLKFTEIDIFEISEKELKNFILSQDLHISTFDGLDRDDLLNLILTHFIEPKMKKNHLYAIYNFPETQAALSKVLLENGKMVAKRFEIYFNSIELANGFFELTDSKEQRQRFLDANKKREELKKEIFKIDEDFLTAIKKIGNCVGVAVGFDRLMMLRNFEDNIQKVLPFAW